MKSFALALGAGGARGLAHIAVFEALDELGVRPVAIAGSSIGALAGAVYAAGMTGKEIRRYVIDLAHDRSEVWRRLMLARTGHIGDLFSGNLSAMRLDAEKLAEAFLPEIVPHAFDALAIPLTVIASDLHRRHEVAFTEGPLRPALAASIALPIITRPVVAGERVLIDGGATNPLPFDLLRGRADVVMAIDVAGPPADDRTTVPNAIEAIYATVVVMTSAIINEKLKHEMPDLLVQPHVGTFRTLDFMQASAILRVAEAMKPQIKADLTALLGGKRGFATQCSRPELVAGQGAGGRRRRATLSRSVRTCPTMTPARVAGGYGHASPPFREKVAQQRGRLLLRNSSIDLGAMVAGVRHEESDAASRLRRPSDRPPRSKAAARARTRPRRRTLRRARA